MKKIVAAVVSAVVALTALIAFTSCKDEKEPVYSGTDEYGRNLGEIYDIDSEETGTFRVSYEISDTSSMGKAMISANCADYVTIERTLSGYTLIFYCNDGMLGNVKMIKESGTIEGKEGDAEGYQSFSFEMTREEFDAKISLECEVTLMNKIVGFSITPDLSNSKLVG